MPPLLWFTAAQQRQQNNKIVIDADGRERLLTFEQAAREIGGIRFGLSASDARLTKWAGLCKVAGVARDERRRITRDGKKHGVDLSQWLASFDAIPLEDLITNIWVDGKWCQA